MQINFSFFFFFLPWYQIRTIPQVEQNNTNEKKYRFLLNNRHCHVAKFINKIY